MNPVLARRVGYTRSEYLSDVAVHIVGLIIVLASVPALIVLAAVQDRSPESVAGAALYGICFLTMIVCSAAYNIFPHPKWEWLLKRLDHSAIYLKIAGTVTGLSLIAEQGSVLAAALWATAVVGISLKLISPSRFKWFSIALYLGMGWAAGILGWNMFAALPYPVAWLVGGAGLFYSVGVGFYLWDQLPFHITIWHLHVLAGSLMLYAAVVVSVSA